MATDDCFAQLPTGICHSAVAVEAITMADRWMQEHHSDSWRRQAIAAGYRARSAFKLKQIQKRFNIIQQGDVVLDVGAHPGGWTQVAVEETGGTGLVLGIDIEPTKPVEGARLLVGDITDSGSQQQILELLEGREIDTVISDISPDISGKWLMDQAIAMNLVAKVFDFALPLLVARGAMVAKVFQGVGIEELIEAVKPHFAKVKRFSPEASRNSSSEVYLVCIYHKPWASGQQGYDITAQMEQAFNDFEPEDEITTVATGFRVIRRNQEEE